METRNDNQKATGLPYGNCEFIRRPFLGIVGVLDGHKALWYNGFG